MGGWSLLLAVRNLELAQHAGVHRALAVAELRTRQQGVHDNPNTEASAQLHIMPDTSP